jgi:hypothetical protein
MKTWRITHPGLASIGHGAGRAGLVAGLVGLLAGGTGCLNNRVTVDIDVTSFVNPADLTGNYAVPSGSPVVEANAPPIAVNLGEAMNKFASAEEMDVDVDVRFDNTTGQGQARIGVFFDDTDTGVFTTPAVTTIAAALAPAQTSTGHAQFKADQRVLDLFRNGQVWMGLHLRWEPDTPDALSGSYTITRIHARVVSRVKGL